MKIISQEIQNYFQYKSFFYGTLGCSIHFREGKPEVNTCKFSCMNLLIAGSA